MKELVATLARFLVEDPDRVFVRERTAAGRTVLELGVAPADRGRVIGRGGRTAAALRTVLEAVAARRGEGCTLEILD
ncbi:MAG TPA: KH domain-containing protein [Vicinamibacteria bacterium]|nr:KH domain-containing protein [Vicinamibacteria bacterium]